MANLKGIAAGAALGTLLGSLAVVFYPKRYEILEAVKDHTSDLTEKAQDLILNHRKKAIHQHDHRQIAGGLLGLSVGIGTALLLAPKTGKQLRAQLANNYNNLMDKADEITSLIRKKASQKVQPKGNKNVRRRSPPKKKAKH